jgi:hypothetical protein
LDLPFPDRHDQIARALALRCGDTLLASAAAADVGADRALDFRMEISDIADGFACWRGYWPWPVDHSRHHREATFGVIEVDSQPGEYTSGCFAPRLLSLGEKTITWK